MKTSSINSTIELNSYISISLCEQTRHYFGGYYHVKILAYCDVPLVEAFFDNVVEFMDARSRMGESTRFERMLQKMAVPKIEIEPVRNQLLKAFNETTLVYLSSPDFARRFVRSTYQKCCNKSVKLSSAGV